MQPQSSHIHRFLTPRQIVESFILSGQEKALLSFRNTFILAILAGVYIGFGAHLATTVATGSFAYFGLKKLLVGAAFSVGLMLVVIPGAELFTGNNLLSVALCSGRVRWHDVLRNWALVYGGNLVGSLLLAFIVAYSSGLLSGEVGATALKIAAAKTSAVGSAGLSHNYMFFFRAIGCNWLVCLAVVMAAASRDIVSKIWSCFFPIMAFVASGFEHCVANMYFIPAGIFAKHFPAAVELSGLSTAQLNGLNWSSMWTQNLIIVTLGNMLAGAVFVGVAYYYVHCRGRARSSDNSNAE